MYDLADVRQLHMEVSTRCNAECPMCCRNLFGATSPGLVERSMSYADFVRVVPVELVGQLDTVDICGAYGDPAMAGDLVAICQHIRESNPDVTVRVFSNGGLRHESWWAALATAGVEVVFAIDGLETNGTYRRRVDLAKVLRNAGAFIAAGGRAQWDYIVFEHNEHEVDEARKLSEDMGFATFSVKRTARFLRPLYEPAPELTAEDGIESHPIYDRSGTVVGRLRPPRTPAYVNETLRWVRGIEDKAAYFDGFFDTCAIRCLAVDSGSLFISTAGHAYPCCWLYVQATLPTVYGRAVTTDPQVADLLAAHGGEASLDAHRLSLREILGGGFFTAVERSWSAGSVAGGKLRTCARVCGQGFDAYRKQFERPELVP